MVVLLLCSFITVNEAATITAIAATTKTVKAPTVTVKTTTVYVGYQNHTIKFKDLVKTAKVTYTSSNAKVAKVSKTGVVTPVKKGKAAITANVKQNNKTYKLKVTVNVENPYIELTSSTDMLRIGSSYQFKAKTYGLKDKVIWSVSDETVATISASGNLQTIAAGTVTVIAKSGKKTISYDVLVGADRLNTISTDLKIDSKTEKTIWVSINDYIQDEELNVTTKGKGIINVDIGFQNKKNQFPITITPKKIGTETIIIKSTETSDFLIINVNVGDGSNKVELSAKQIFEVCSSSTVEIHANVFLGGSQGSGFFIGEGIIVTNYHVIEGSKKIKVTTSDKKEYNVTTILGCDPNLDIAILKIDLKGNTVLPIYNGPVVVGETIYALGSPLGLTATLSNGIVSSSSRILDGIDYIQNTASISPGNSGGPLINVYGEVMGINTGAIEEGQSLNFAINISELDKIDLANPVAVSDFTKVIVENPALSKVEGTCQEVPSDIEVVGSVSNAEGYDLYKFTMAKEGYFMSVLTADSKEQLEKICFVLWLNDKEYYVSRTIESYDFMFVKLKPGTYYITVETSEDYIGTDSVPYSFMLGY